MQGPAYKPPHSKVCLFIAALVVCASASALDVDPMDEVGIAITDVDTSSCSKLLGNVGLGGQNMRESYSDWSLNVSHCCLSCDKLGDCIGWTLNVVDEKCFLKSKLSSPQNLPGSTSGIKPGHSPSPPSPTGPVPEPPLPPVPPAPSKKCIGRCPNVLFIIADDMRPQLGCYGHDFMKTPNIDQLAATGTLFNRAYVQYSFCAPSRNSFMSGRRPDRTRVWNFMQNFRVNGQGSDWTSLPQNFKANGYLTMGTGKTFHPGDPIQFDYPHSWSFEELPYTFGGTANPGHSSWKNTTSDHIWCDNRTVVCAGGEEGCPDIAKVDGDENWCSIDTSKLPNGQKLYDQEEAAFAIQRLQYAAQQQNKARAQGDTPRPFFLGVGFHRPHLPWIAPKEYFELYPSADEIAGPVHPNIPDGMPYVAWHGGIAKSISDPLSLQATQLARRGLYATMSYVDDLIGSVLHELDKLDLTNSTIVSLVGDHGQQVGEHNLWEKMTNFELGVRIPVCCDSVNNTSVLAAHQCAIQFIIRAPWLTGSLGRRSNALVEIVDLYRTLSDLAGIPVPTNDSKPVQGESLVPAMVGNSTLKNYSFSQFAKSGPDRAPFGTCMGCFPTGNSAADFMGFSVRSASWRYTEWYRYNKTLGQPAWENLFAVELYDHRNDKGDDFDSFENVNLANSTDPSAPATIAMELLRPVLRQQFQRDA